MRPAKTQISLGIHPVWLADAQADRSLRWAHTQFVGFVMSRLRQWQKHSKGYKISKQKQGN